LLTKPNLVVRLQKAEKVEEYGPTQPGGGWCEVFFLIFPRVAEAG
jgi:hypothetical protein